MGDISLNYVLTGTDKSASKTMEQTATAGQRAGQAVGRAFSGLGSQIGGEVGELLTRVGIGIDQLATRGLNAGQKLTVVGTTVTGLGIALMQLGSASKAADDQLSAAFEAAGADVESYRGEIDQLIASQARLGNDDDAVKNALRTMTTALGDPTKALQKMGLVADYAAAKNISLEASAEVLAKALSGGSTRAFTAMGIVVEDNVDGTKNLEKATDELAAKLDGQASAAANNFAGWMKSVWVTTTDMAEDFGTTVGPAITVVGGILTGVSAIMQIVTAVQTARAAATTAATAAEVAHFSATSAAASALSAETVALIANTGATNASSAANARAGSSVGAMAGKVALAGGALTLITLTIGAFIDAQARSQATTDALADSLDSATGAVTAYTREFVTKRLEEEGAFDSAAKAGVSQQELTDAVIEGGDALTAMMQRLQDATSGVDHLGQSFDGTNVGILGARMTIQTLSDELDSARSSWKNTTAATGDATSATESARDAYLEAQAGVSGLVSELIDLVDVINKANGVGQDAVSANIKYQEAIRGVDEVVQRHIDEFLKPQRDAYLEANGTLEGFAGDLTGFAANLDVATAAGAENYNALLNVASAGQDAAAAQLALDGDTKAYVAALQANRDTVLQNAKDLGATDEQLQYISDHIVAMPSQKEIELLVNSRPAEIAISEFLARPRTATISLMGIPSSAYQRADGGTIGRADGGTISHMAFAGTVTGAGTPTSDTATRRPTMLSIGEEVTRAYAASYPGVRPMLKAINANPAAAMAQIADASRPAVVVQQGPSGSAPRSGPSSVVIDQSSMAEFARAIARALRTRDRDGGAVDH